MSYAENLREIRTIRAKHALEHPEPAPKCVKCAMWADVEAEIRATLGQGESSAPSENELPSSPVVR